MGCDVRKRLTQGIREKQDSGCLMLQRKIELLSQPLLGSGPAGERSCLSQAKGSALSQTGRCIWLSYGIVVDYGDLKLCSHGTHWAGWRVVGHGYGAGRLSSAGEALCCSGEGHWWLQVLQAEPQSSVWHFLRLWCHETSVVSCSSV